MKPGRHRRHNPTPRRLTTITAAALAIVRKPWPRRFTIATATVALIVGGWAGVAQAVQPKPGQGMISLVTQECGSSDGWQTIAEANGIVGPEWIVRLGQNVVINCPGTAAPAPAPAPVASGWAHPVPGACVGSGYGWRSYVLNGSWTSDFHYGIDWPVGSGTPVRAIGNGQVTGAFWDAGAGNVLVIDHGNGWTSHLMHNSRFAVAYGTWVVAGQVVAYSGGTGWWTTGPHVHLSVRQWGSNADPGAFLRNRGVGVC
jgi:murein DD-endopeptidase MepM/ murein hydrolase activator NlpD